MGGKWKAWAGASLLWLAPGAAYAISASLSDAGNGSVSNSSINMGRNNWGGSGSLRSNSNKLGVYFGSIIVYNNYPDANCGRSSGDVVTSTYSSIGVSCNTMSAVSPDSDGVRIRICQNKPNITDPCGSWSATFWR